MKVSVDKSVKNEVTMEIEVAVDVVAAGMDKAVAAVSKKVNIPGFRKGKVPRMVLENFVGKEYILNEAADQLITDAYWDAIEQEKIDPVDNPKIDIVTLELEKPLVFKATVTVKPEVKLGAYKGLEVKRPEVKILAKDVDAEIKRMQQRLAKVVEVEAGKKSKNGDTLTIDFEGFINGEPFPGGKGDGYPLEIGSKTFIPGFEEQLTGVVAGANVDVNVTFPEDYHQAEFAGKEALFKVTVHDIKRKELPALDDDFAKDVSETADTIADLKKEVKERLVKQANEEADNRVKDMAIDQMLEGVEVEIPEVMIERRINEMIADMEQNLRMQGMTLEQYMEYAKVTREQMADYYRPQAEGSVKYDLALEEICKQENIEPSEEMLNEQLAIMAESSGRTAEDIKKDLVKSGRIDSYIFALQMMKAADVVKNSVVVVK